MTRNPLRRVVLSAAATVSGVVLLLALKPHAEPGPGLARSASPAPAASGSSSGSSGSTAAPSFGTGNRTAVGDTVQTRFGPVQVKVTITGGRLADVTPVQLPAGNRRDQMIDQYAVPQLTSEAIAAQSAQIDFVSGASFTSQGYIESLQSALDKARG